MRIQGFEARLTRGFKTPLEMSFHFLFGRMDTFGQHKGTKFTSKSNSVCNNLTKYHSYWPLNSMGTHRQCEMWRTRSAMYGEAWVTLVGADSAPKFWVCILRAICSPASTTALRIGITASIAAVCTASIGALQKGEVIVRSSTKEKTRPMPKVSSMPPSAPKKWRLHLDYFAKVCLLHLLGTKRSRLGFQLGKDTTFGT